MTESEKKYLLVYDPEITAGYFPSVAACLNENHSEERIDHSTTLMKLLNKINQSRARHLIIIEPLIRPCSIQILYQLVGHRDGAPRILVVSNTEIPKEIKREKTDMEGIKDDPKRRELYINLDCCSVDELPQKLKDLEGLTETTTSPQ